MKVGGLVRLIRMQLYLILTVFLAVVFPLCVKAEAPVEATLDVEQIVVKNTSRDVNDVFDYNLIPLDDTCPMPEGALNGIWSCSLKGTGACKIPVTFTNPGIYPYQINVKKPFAADGYSVVPEAFQVTVFVKNLEGKLSVQTVVETDNGRKTGGIRFENTYTPKASDPRLMADPPVQKTVSGNPPGMMTFTFALTAGDESFPMPEGSINGVKKINIIGAGQTSFGTWAYTREGIYHYEIAEVPLAARWYSYDKSVYTITDYVEDIAGQLLVTRSVMNEEKKPVSSFIFNNKYQKSVIKGDGGKNVKGGKGGKGAVIADLAVPEAAVGAAAGIEGKIMIESTTAVGGNVPKVGDEGNIVWYTAIFSLSVMAASGCMIYLILNGRRSKGK